VTDRLQSVFLARQDFVSCEKTASEKAFVCTRERKRNEYEEERVTEKQVSFSADRRENQGARRLAGQDAQPAPYLSQGSRSRSCRGVEMERGSGVVARRIDLHRRNLQERREDDLLQRGGSEGSFGPLQLQS